MQRTLELSYDKIIIGADESALRFSLDNNIPIIFLRTKQPLLFNIEFGKEQIDNYNNLFFNVILKNLSPFSNLIKTIRFEDDNTLKAITKNNLSVTIKFNELFLSDDYKVEGLIPPTDKTSTKNIVNDYFKVVHAKTKTKFLKTKDDLLRSYFIHKIKPRIYHVSTSIIDDKDLDLFEWSQTAVKIKLKKLLIQNGFKGRWDKTNKHFKIITVESVERKVFPLGKNIYTDLPPNIKTLC